MKIEMPNGDVVEIKVYHAGAKKADDFATHMFVDDLALGMTGGAAFTEGNGMHTRALEYFEMAKAFGKAVENKI